MDAVVNYDNYYKFNEIKTYSSTEWLAGSKKKYRQVFDSSKVTYIYIELSFYNKRFDRDNWDLEGEIKCYSAGERGRELCSLPVKRKIYHDKNIFYIHEGWGSKEVGRFWKKGEYSWKVYVHDVEIASKIFYVEDFSNVEQDEGTSLVEVYSLRLFEGPQDYLGAATEDRQDRVYLDQFAHIATRYVYAEMIMKNINDIDVWQCELIGKFYTNLRELKGEVIELRRIEKGKEKIEITVGWGANTGGGWTPGVYSVEFILFDEIIAKKDFVIGEKYVDELQAHFENFTNNTSNRSTNNITLKNIPVDLQVAFQQYLLFFRDYVRLAKDKEVNYNVKITDVGLEIEIADHEQSEILQTYLYEYLDFARHNYVGIINVEGDPSNKTIDILRMRLEQQVHNLNMELKFKELQVNELNEQLFDVKKEKLQLLDIVDKTVTPVHPLALSQANNRSISEKDNFKRNCKRNIGDNKIELVIQNVIDYTDDESLTNLHNDCIFVKNKWERLKREAISDQVTFDQLQLERARIINALINLIELI